jgi:MtN3 and saliva related transmembrane protein
MPPEIIGWAASAVLLATLVRQIATQVRDGSAQGVSHWLFVGQITASVGFVTYSALVGDWVFIITNACILMTAIVGQVLTSQRRRAAPEH